MEGHRHFDALVARAFICIPASCIAIAPSVARSSSTSSSSTKHISLQIQQTTRQPWAPRRPHHVALHLHELNLPLKLQSTYDETTPFTRSSSEAKERNKG